MPRSSSSSPLILLAAVCGLCLLIASGGVVLAQAISLAEQAETSGRQLPSSGPTLALVESPELTVRVLENLLRSIIYSASAAELQATTK